MSFGPPKNLPVRNIVMMSPVASAPPEMPKTLMPSAILAVRECKTSADAAVIAHAATASSASEKPRRGRESKMDKIRAMRAVLDERILELRESNATRKEVMDYFAERIKELSSD